MSDVAATKVAVVLSAAFLAPGCDPPAAIDPVADIRSRTSVEFAAASLFRIEPTSTPGFDVYMAPMLLVERSPASGPSRVSLGALRRTKNGDFSVDPTRPVVYFERTNVSIAGTDRDQLAFLWFFSPVGGRAPRVQGVRYTLDDAGFPVIQEVLADPSGLRVLFTAERLSASEADGDVDPRAVVAKTMRDGRVPMGPFVYMRPKSFEVTTLLCRCAPSQVSALPDDITYTIVPLEKLKDVGIEAPRWSPELLESSAPEPAVPNDWLERVLVFPKGL